MNLFFIFYFNSLRYIICAFDGVAIVSFISAVRTSGQSLSRIRDTDQQTSE